MAKVSLLGGSGQVAPVQPVGAATQPRVDFSSVLDPIIEQLTEELRRTKNKADRKELEAYISELEVRASKQKRQDEADIGMETFKKQHRIGRVDETINSMGPAGHLLEATDPSFRSGIEAAYDEIAGLVPEPSPNDSQGVDAMHPGTGAMIGKLAAATSKLSAMNDKITQEHTQRATAFDRKQNLQARVRDAMQGMTDALNETGRQLFSIASGRGTAGATEAIIREGVQASKDLRADNMDRIAIGGQVASKWNAIRTGLGDIPAGYTVTDPNFKTLEPDGTWKPRIEVGTNTYKGAQSRIGATVSALQTSGFDPDTAFLVKASLAYSKLPADQAEAFLGTADAGRIRELVAQSGGDPTTVSGSQVLRAIGKLGPKTASRLQAAMSSLKNEIDSTLNATEATSKLKQKPGEEVQAPQALDPAHKQFYVDWSRDVAELGLSLDPLVMQQYSANIAKLKKLELFERNWRATGGNTEKATRITGTQSVLEGLAQTMANIDEMEKNPDVSPEELEQVRGSVAATITYLKEYNPAVGGALDKLYSLHGDRLSKADIATAYERNAQQIESERGTMGRLTPEDEASLSELEQGLQGRGPGISRAKEEFGRVRGAQNPLAVPSLKDTPEALDENTFRELLKPSDTKPKAPAPQSPAPTTQPVSARDGAQAILYRAAESDPTLVPNPYLAAVDFHRRRGMRDATDRVRKDYEAQRAMERTAEDAQDKQLQSLMAEQGQVELASAQQKPKKSGGSGAPSLAAPFQGAA